MLGCYVEDLCVILRSDHGSFFYVDVNSILSSEFLVMIPRGLVYDEASRYEIA